MTEQNPELIAGRYQLVERIGQGGMGRVWRGLDQQLFGREVAVKEILFPPGLDDGDRAALLRRFTSEARAAVTLSHPGVITVHDVVEHHGAPVIVMELIRGQSLAAAIKERGRLPVRRVAEIGAAMLDALAEAHGARIVHRDIKPDNVLLTKDRVVLTDFGIAHLADATTKLSHSGTVIGTPQYMPPEQLEGKRPTPANDLWALGATLYHAVEGHPPFDADGLHALAVAVFTRPHRPPVHAGPLTPVLDALLTKDPAQRVSAADAAEMLASVLRSSPPRTDASVVHGPTQEDGPTHDHDPGREPAPTPTPAPRVPTPTPAPRVPTPTPDPRVPAPAPDAAAEHASAPTRPQQPPTPSPPTPTVQDSGSASPPHHPVPDRPTAPPASPADDTVTLGATATSEHVERASARRRPGLTRRSAILGTALAVLTTGSVLTWTLTRDDDAPRDGAAGSGAGATSVTVVIGVDAPLSGGLSSMGAGVRNSADLAVRTANESRHVPGVTFEIKALDDEADPAKGAPNAAQFVSDDKVLGVVGPLNSGVARTLVPPLARAGVVNVSPGNTDPVLTLGPDWAAGTSSRPHATYFRTIATDVAQGPFAARHLHGAKMTKLYVIDDASPHGTAVTAGLTAEFTKLGGTVVGTEQIDPAERAFAGLAVRVRSSGADAVYFGGYYDAAAPLSQQLKQAGVSVPLMGGDGIFDQQYLTANPEAEGDLATNIGLPAEESEPGRDFLARYEKAGYPQEAGWYGPYAYDATWTLIEAVKAVVTANGGTLPDNARAKLAEAVAGSAFDGVTGRVAFDEYGDTVNRRLTVYTVNAGSWKVVTSGPAAP
ncbi:bifunctional serine/threonine-protein kinase/ABC transporter substrate-binding protein [Streptomyces sp. Je 1-79]|uniref:bifunctional serine/threonine-protein kinase/ABC transporter substrate-binding protein n=1 Tax=Streptomyces sp. Je 1-79 TaxID=2943847 RepID=UPI0021A5BF4B|nr:bifunctional serine/threonine-protein kinase/ABC transporter substrate-binding protein [Streptomyces sp. Je 1-79]MCT4353444.1 bifunctional serine/threonine-protein kinase/ABC transporter substrate-binding protein [Streptomyces sp. Je 1-79]